MKRRLSFWQLKASLLLVLAAFMAMGAMVSPTAYAQSIPPTPGGQASKAQQSVARNAVSKQLSIQPRIYSPSTLTLTPTMQNVTCTSSKLKGVNTATPPRFTEFSLPNTASEPASIIKATDGSFWFTEYAGDQIGHITATGQLTECPISTGAHSLFLTIGPDRKIWFTEPDNGYVSNIVSTGPTSATLTEFAGTGLVSPEGIVQGPDGNLWFADSGNNTIDEINTVGSGTAFGGLTPGASPFDITVGPDRALWFTEYYASQIGRITLHGDVLEFTGMPSNSAPYGITTGPDNALWFTENLVGKIGRIDTQGFYSEPTDNSLSTVSYPNLITSYNGNTLMFTEFGTSQIGRTTETGTVTQYNVPSSSAQPYGIVNSGKNSIWFTEYGSGKIGVLTTR